MGKRKVPMCDKNFLDGVDRRAAKGRAVAQLAIVAAGLTTEQLDHLADRHARWKAVRIHDQVRTPTRCPVACADTIYNSGILKAVS